MRYFFYLFCQCIKIFLYLCTISTRNDGSTMFLIIRNGDGFKCSFLCLIQRYALSVALIHHPLPLFALRHNVNASLAQQIDNGIPQPPLFRADPCSLSVRSLIQHHVPLLVLAFKHGAEKIVKSLVYRVRILASGVGVGLCLAVPLLFGCE